MKIRKGALVKALPGTIEGDPEKLGLGIVITEPEKDKWGQWSCHVQFITQSKPWYRYIRDLELVNSLSSALTSSSSRDTL